MIFSPLITPVNRPTPSAAFIASSKSGIWMLLPGSNPLEVKVTFLSISTVISSMRLRSWKFSTRLRTCSEKTAELSSA